MQEFSYRTREESLRRFRSEVFDFLIVGGGITGAATARDAASRGLKVALVEAKDFAWGTSSRSSKLIHGGLRYLEHAEFKLVFEALAERSHLLKTAPHLVRPILFFLPVFKKRPPGRFLLACGLWLYDLLSLFRTPGIHRRLSRKKLLKQIPFLKADGLSGGFQYFDATMRDDALTLETLRAAARLGAAVANYTEAMKPIWEGDRLGGFVVKDREKGEEISVRAKKVIVCAGPWADQLGQRLSPNWKPWLVLSKGIHLVFDWKKIPVPGTVVMSCPEDGRIAFVIPRRDLGPGVVIVGTTDSPAARDPEQAAVDSHDVHYLMKLLKHYFPSLPLSTADIVSTYVGVRPLMGGKSDAASTSGALAAEDLQKVSREHFIGEGPGDSVLVTGGKYTTHRTMAREIVDFAVKGWKEPVGDSNTQEPVNPTPEDREKEILKIHRSLQDAEGTVTENVEGFPSVEAQFCHEMRTGMVLHLEDFYLRRIPLFMARRDHGLPLAEKLASLWAKERNLDVASVPTELENLKKEFERRDAWRKTL